MGTDVGFVDIAWGDRTVRIEHAWLAPERTGQPLMVFLHEGLGSLAMWKDFPQQLCDALGCRGLVYSRPGYGRSTPRAADEVWQLDFMHRQAHEVLPALLHALHVDPSRDRLWLFGHSDGGSIALLFAAACTQPLGGVIVLAPHILVEDLSVSSIEEARQAYLTGSGCTRRFVHGRSKTRSTRLPAPCWQYRAWTTLMARSNKSTASLAVCRRPGFAPCPTAGIRRTGTRRMRWSPK